MTRYGQVDQEYAAQLATTPPDDDGPIYMLNLMKYREWADYGPDGEQGVTGREADDRYAPIDVLHDLGADIVFVGEVVASAEGWHRVAVVRYPTRRSFIEMQARSDFQALHVHKDAGMERTIILGTVPSGDLPAAGGAGRVVLEVAATTAGPEADGVFTVEGTIVGDGRQWSQVRWSVTDSNELPSAVDGAQSLLLQPFIERW